MTFAVIGDEDTVLGFALVGLRGKAVASPQEAEDAFRAILDEEEVGIIIITERVSELIRPLVDQYIFNRTFPLIVEIPDRFGKMEGRLTLREMVNQAIGIKL